MVHPSSNAGFLLFISSSSIHICMLYVCSHVHVINNNYYLTGLHNSSEALNLTRHSRSRQCHQRFAQWKSRFHSILSEQGKLKIFEFWTCPISAKFISPGYRLHIYYTHTAETHNLIFLTKTHLQSNRKKRSIKKNIYHLFFNLLTFLF